MEVNNAIEEFKRYDQEYDEARVREQVIASLFRRVDVHVIFPVDFQVWLVRIKCQLIKTTRLFANKACRSNSKDTLYFVKS